MPADLNSVGDAVGTRQGIGPDIMIHLSPLAVMRGMNPDVGALSRGLFVVGFPFRQRRKNMEGPK